MISGTIGSKQSTAEMKENYFKLSIKNKTLMNSLSIICFQRTGLQLKTIDVVWISPETVQVQTISSKDYNAVCTNAFDIPTYDLGSQVGSWKKWQKTALQEQWSIQNWKEFIQAREPEECESESDSNDSDWQPQSDDESDDDYMSEED